MKRALISGITGQDGSYLAELLLSKGYEVHGVVRRSSSLNTGRIDHLYRDPHESGCRLFLHFGDMADSSSLLKVLMETEPDEVYNLAAQSHVKVSFEQPAYTGDVVAIGTTRLLEAIRASRLQPRYYQASSSELFGNQPAPQSERTPFDPRSPYAAAKAYAFQMTKLYREAYGLHASNGILFNHESPRRGETFVTRKITKAAARIKAGLQDWLYLGNMDAKRDWGFAGDYVKAMWLMLQQDQPDDYVIATGETHSVQEFADAAFERLGMTPRDFVKIDPRYLRPAEVDCLQGDASKARERLGWAPQTTFGELVNLMADADWQAVRHERRAA